MPKPFQFIFYGVMVLISLLAMYSLLNAGNPHSLLRYLFPDPKDDVYVAVVSSALVFVFGFFVFYSGDREGFRQLVALNADNIRALRRKRKSDEAIADEILAAMGSRSGYKHNLARRKLIIYLSEFE